MRALRIISSSCAGLGSVPYTLDNPAINPCKPSNCTPSEYGFLANHSANVADTLAIFIAVLDCLQRQRRLFIRQTPFQLRVLSRERLLVSHPHHSQRPFPSLIHLHHVHRVPRLRRTDLRRIHFVVSKSSFFN